MQKTFALALLKRLCHGTPLPGSFASSVKAGSSLHILHGEDTLTIHQAREVEVHSIPPSLTNLRHLRGTASVVLLRSTSTTSSPTSSTVGFTAQPVSSTPPKGWASVQSIDSAVDAVISVDSLSDVQDLEHTATILSASSLLVSTRSSECTTDSSLLQTSCGRDASPLPEATDFPNALMDGLAPGGGLYVPLAMPPFSAAEQTTLLAAAAAGDYAAYASFIARRLALGYGSNPSIDPATLTKDVKEAYRLGPWRKPEVLPLTLLPDEHLGVSSSGANYLAEQWHGPTCAFKDFALQLFPLLFKRVSAGAPNTFAIATATSGDTGSACMAGFIRQCIPTVVLFPATGVSPVQRDHMLALAQMVAKQPVDSFHLTSAPFCSAIPVDGDFDFCQSLLKSIFADTSVSQFLREEHGLQLSSANSINWGRMLPQIVYHGWSYARMVSFGAVQRGSPIIINVPTGNFGNIFAALLAEALGLTVVDRYVLASNVNDVLVEFIRTGIYDISKRSLIITASPSIDILRSSNVERLIYLLALLDAVTPTGQPLGSLHEAFTIPIDRLRNAVTAAQTVTSSLFACLASTGRMQISSRCSDWLQSRFYAVSASEGATMQALARAHSGHPGPTIDPHTAVGVHAMAQFRSTFPSVTHPAVISSTAHWAKFPGSVAQSMSLLPHDWSPIGQLTSAQIMQLFDAIWFVS